MHIFGFHGVLVSIVGYIDDGGSRIHRNGWCICDSASNTSLRAAVSSCLVSRDVPTFVSHLVTVGDDHLHRHRIGAKPRWPKREKHSVM
jgi:hypothetical protein